MRSRSAPDDSAAEVTRRRLDALIAELSAARGEPPAPPAVPPGPVGNTPAPAPTEPPGAAPSWAAPPAGRHARRPLTARRRWVAWVEDRLPVSWQGRAHLGSAQFGVVALVVSVGLVLGAWWLVRSGGSSSGPAEVAAPRPVIAPPTATGSSAPPPSPGPALGGAGSRAGGEAPTGGTVTTASEGQIVVDVIGKVRRPGIAVLPAGSRVVDAVRAAGGMRSGVDRASVNLARLLTDGEQVVVGLPGATGSVAGSSAPAPGGAGVTGGAGALVNLNTADQAALETLPGVGPVTAAAILEWRAEHGGFTSVDELLEVSGIGDATLAEIAPHVTL